MTSNEKLWAEFHEAGYDTLWYANIGPGGYRNKRSGPRWHAGVAAGPENDLVCVMPTHKKESSRREEVDLAEVYLSPGGWTPEEAAELALAKRCKLREL